MLRLYNTLTRCVQEFIPLDPEHIRFYVCGPTVYNFAHIGNARPIVVFDVLFRVLRRLYRRVTYVRNITDIDDKIILAARDNQETVDSLTARMTHAFHQDIAALGALPVTHEPRATDHISEMIDLITLLIQRGHAYYAQEHVLFEIATYPAYGALSRRKREELIAGARVEVAPYKRDPADFILWKPSQPDEPGYPSPWGYGRPGWHIECSAMASKYLGTQFDIHGGGGDLIFPHHENEIAQSTCAHDGHPLASFWIHNGFVQVDHRKMSKSLGNIVTVRDLLDQGWRGEVIRLALLATHYRQPLDFTQDSLIQAQNVLDRWYALLLHYPPPPNSDNDPSILDDLLDDLNIPSLLAKMGQRMDVTAGKGLSQEAYRTLFLCGETLGLLRHDPQEWFHQKVEGISVDEIEHLIEKRNQARAEKNFPQADQIRDRLKRYGITLEDRPDKTTWRKR